MNNHNPKIDQNVEMEWNNARRKNVDFELRYPHAAVSISRKIQGTTRNDERYEFIENVP